MLAVACLGGPEGKGQSEGRSLRTWVDTLNLPLCEQGTFETWGVWIESASSTDTVVGFRLQDSVLAVELTLRWDTSRVRLLPPYVLTPVQSLVGRLVSKVQAVDTVTGELYISASADLSLRPAVGTGIPLFYLKGRVRPSDTAVGIPEGGARVQQISLEGRLGEEVTTVRHLPGYVQIVRDTTPEYTGRLSLIGTDMDTANTDSIEVTGENIDSQRVRELSFSLVVDTTAVMFAEVLPLAVDHPWGDVERSIELADGRIDVRYGRSDGAELPTVGTASLLEVLLHRTTDSQFIAEVEIVDGGINGTSCLGRVTGMAGSISGARIVPVDTTGDTTTVGVRNGHDQLQERRYIETLAGGVLMLAEGVREVSLYDPAGRQLGLRPIHDGQPMLVEIEKGYSGPIFAVLRLTDGRILRVKQYITSE